MFDSLPTISSISNEEFKLQAQKIRQQLLLAQRAINTLNRPVIIIVAGLDGAGKGSVVHRINEWMDARHIDTHAFMAVSDEEETRPLYWRFWRRLPDKGTIGILFGSWYTEPREAALRGDIDKHQVRQHGKAIERFERMLSDDGAIIIKLWFHISSEAQYRQLAHKVPVKQQNLLVPVNAKQAKTDYKKTVKIAEQLLFETDSVHSPWYIIQAEDKNHRDIAAGQRILQSLTNLTDNSAQKEASGTSANTYEQPLGHALATIDLDSALSKKDYKRQLKKYQKCLQSLAWEFYDQKRSVVAVFEGWDAAGKGSAIRRVTTSIDPRLYRLRQFAAPTDEERRQHYLWRFWRKLERDGCSTLFDRSWYGRVLVERIEQFATPEQWQRSFEEINQFEQQIVDHGTTILKFWLHISPEEQLRRFEARQQQPHKQYKITDDDWRNRDKWQAYEHAVEDMFHHTSTDNAPWTLVAANDKRFARIQVLKTFCKAMEDSLNNR
jgi:polyphosphate:AMP phosphotransferase